MQLVGPVQSKQGNKQGTQAPDDTIYPVEHCVQTNPAVQSVHFGSL
jgi:hypothetical protein